ncbi:hypothetical protein SK128_023017 [Halocaridina rubra]|uniref:Uncharacterized protein n=1 Tax=Halocaridina rubra TaxID=373956 RepID=A0AAN8XTG9_HALRR
MSPEIHINGIVRAAYAFLANVRLSFRHVDKERFRNSFVAYRLKVDCSSLLDLPLKKHTQRAQ